MSKSKDSTLSKKIHDYLIDQNRPFSANDIFNNLQTDCSKTALSKALDILVSEEKVKCKTYGKQKVFYINQNLFSESKNEDVQSLDCQINDLSNTLITIQKQVKNFEDIIEDLGKSLTTEMAETELKDVKEDILVLNAKLKSMESKSVHLDPMEMKALIGKKEMYQKQYQCRKRMANDVINAILEGYPKSKKQLLEELGVETDSDQVL